MSTPHAPTPVIDAGAAPAGGELLTAPPDVMTYQYSDASAIFDTDGNIVNPGALTETDIWALRVRGDARDAGVLALLEETRVDTAVDEAVEDVVAEPAEPEMVRPPEAEPAAPAERPEAHAHETPEERGMRLRGIYERLPEAYQQIVQNASSPGEQAQLLEQMAPMLEILEAVEALENPEIGDKWKNHVDALDEAYKRFLDVAKDNPRIPKPAPKGAEVLEEGYDDLQPREFVEQFDEEIRPELEEAEYSQEEIDEIFHQIVVEQLIPEGTEYVPTRREITRLQGKVLNLKAVDDNESLLSKAQGVIYGKLVNDLNEMFPNGLEHNEAQGNEAFKEMMKRTTGNGDDNLLRIIFARETYVEGRGVILTAFDSDGVTPLTNAEKAFRKRRLAYLRDNLADLGAASWYEVTKMQEDMQEEGWNQMINVWHQIGLTQAEIVGLYTAIKFGHKGTMLTNKYRKPELIMRQDGTSFYQLGDIDRTGYAVEMFEKVPKHGLAWSTADAEYQRTQVEESLQRMREYFFNPDDRKIATEVIDGHTTTARSLLALKPVYEKAGPRDPRDENGNKLVRKTITKGKKQYIKYNKVVDVEKSQDWIRRKHAVQFVEDAFFLLHMYGALKLSKMGMNTGEPGEDAMEAAAQRQREMAADRMRGMGEYDPQIPAAGAANLIWQDIEKILKEAAVLFPQIKQNPPRHKPGTVYEELDGKQWILRGDNDPIELRQRSRRNQRKFRKRLHR